MSNLKILLVDDEQDLTSMLKRFCLKKGFEVKTADSVEQAIIVIQEYIPDIAVLDFNLNDKLGTDLIKPIKQINDACAIFIFTAYINAVKQQKDHLLHIKKIYEKPAGLPLLKTSLLSFLI